MGGIIQKTTSIWQAFKAGRELANATTWKNRANAIAAITAFMGAIFAIASAWGYQVDITQVDTQALAGGIIAALSMFHAIVHLITSAKVGFGGAIYKSPVQLQPISESADSASQPTAIPGTPVVQDQRADSGNQLQRNHRIDPDTID